MVTSIGHAPGAEQGALGRVQSQEQCDSRNRWCQKGHVITAGLYLCIALWLPGYGLRKALPKGTVSRSQGWMRAPVHQPCTDSIPGNLSQTCSLLCSGHPWPASQLSLLLRGEPWKWPFSISHITAESSRRGRQGTEIEAESLSCVTFGLRNDGHSTMLRGVSVLCSPQLQTLLAVFIF